MDYKPLAFSRFSYGADHDDVLDGQGRREERPRHNAREIKTTVRKSKTKTKTRYEDGDTTKLTYTVYNITTGHNR